MSPCLDMKDCRVRHPLDKEGGCVIRHLVSMSNYNTHYLSTYNKVYATFSIYDL